MQQKSGYVSRVLPRMGIVAIAAVALSAGAVGGAQAQSAQGNGITSVNAVASAGVFNLPWDATPDPQGKTVYFTATSVAGAGIFSVPADGGSVKTVAVGAPVVMPRVIANSPDGKQLSTADPFEAG